MVRKFILIFIVDFKKGFCRGNVINMRYLVYEIYFLYSKVRFGVFVVVKRLVVFKVLFSYFYLLCRGLFYIMDDREKIVLEFLEFFFKIFFSCIMS